MIISFFLKNLFFRIKIYSFYLTLILTLFSFNSYSISLTETIQNLYKTDSSIRSAEAGLIEAKNDIKTAWAAYLPEFDVKIEGGDESQFKNNADNSHLEFHETDFTFKQKLWDFGDTGSDISQKNNALDVALLDLQAAKATLIIDAVDAYLGYIDAVKKLDSETESLNNKIESTGQEESRVKKGSGIASDVLQAKADLAESQKSKITAEGDLRKAYNKYVKVFKTEPPSSIDSMQLIELSPEGKIQLPKSYNDANQVALEKNVDLQTKKIDLLDAEQDLISARSKFLPTLDAEATYKYKYNVGATAGSKEEVLGKIIFKLPLQPWQDLPDYRNKKSALVTAQTDLEEEKYATEQTVSDLWEDYQVALLTRDFAENKVVISEELLSIKKRERQLDQADAAAVTAAENAINDDTKTLIDDETALTETSLDLLEAMGILTLTSIQDQPLSEETAVSGLATTETTTTTEETTTTTEETTTTTETQEEEGAPPEAAPVEPVVITNYTDEEQAQLTAEAEEARKLIIQSSSTEAVSSESSATEGSISSGCPSNTYIGQQQADGSWKTVCKK